MSSENSRHHTRFSNKKNTHKKGFVEDWSENKEIKSNERSEWGYKVRSLDDKDIQQPLVTDVKTSSQKLTITSSLVSIILSTQTNLLLNKNNSYDIRFSTGILEGSGISINETGNVITFEKEGSYRFEICGEGALFSDVDVKLTYASDEFNDDIKPFSEITIPKEEGKLILRGIPTILPISKCQQIIPRLVPTPDESIVLLSGTRLLIHKVA
jgi:hypothetical protein